MITKPFFLTLLILSILLMRPLNASTAFTQGADDREYFSFEVDESELQGPPSAAGLNSPLTPADRIIANGRHFYRVGPDLNPTTRDDQRIRLFGANLSFAANFPDESLAADLAARLRKAGFNAVRLHHLDFHLDDGKEHPNGILSTGPYPTFNQEAVGRLRSLINALSSQGIYVNLNLRVGYRFRPAIDGLPALDDGASTQKFLGSPIHVYFPPLITRQETYARELISQLGLVKNPALAMVEINNESSLLHAWQTQEWQDALPSAYAGVLRDEWEVWVLKRYGSIEAACKAWAGCGALPGDQLLPYSLFDQGSPPQRKLTQLLSRVGLASQNEDDTARHRDFLIFLATMDKRYLDRMKAVVQEAAGWNVPVTGTQVIYGGVLNFDSHADMDYIDEHTYIGHPIFNSPNWQSEDWYIPNVAISATEVDTLLSLSLRRAADKPFVVSEFNQPYPSRTSAEILPMMAAVGALQDWDGLFFFGYSDEPEPYHAPNQFSLSGDWGKYAFSGQSARIFRQYLLPPLPFRTTLPFSASARLTTALQGPIRSGTLETRLEQVFGQTPSLAWKTQLSQDLSATMEPTPGDTTALANYGEASPFVVHDREQRRIQFVSPKAYGLFGSLDDTPVALGRFQFSGIQKSAEPVALLMTSLDSQELPQSSHILLTLAGFTTGSQPGSLPKRPKTTRPYPQAKQDRITLEPEPLSRKPSGRLTTTPPTWVERTPVRMLIPALPAQVHIYPLDAAGRREAALPLQTHTDPDSTGILVELQQAPDNASIWYELVLDAAPHAP
ncbi:capsular biosynthesis protein [Pusillimonas sp. CC-YST705]|uniref:Capsular biosynthesis protein n=1 Tax=Mesopusillimonas faecipullorum TaxID=2755040 RepID=A0ABS8CFG3_9BURK|nr:capsular biosynthesis protein [Mesopusillimonas faecipullorum]MCB5364549.1 capsular biosynthesis protein [Mesopusillimonas faecipullorum]